MKDTEDDCFHTTKFNRNSRLAIGPTLLCPRRCGVWCGLSVALSVFFLMQSVERAEKPVFLRLRPDNLIAAFLLCSSAPVESVLVIVVCCLLLLLLCVVCCVLCCCLHPAPGFGRGRALTTESEKHTRARNPAVPPDASGGKRANDRGSRFTVHSSRPAQASPRFVVSVSLALSACCGANCARAPAALFSLHRARLLLKV